MSLLRHGSTSEDVSTQKNSTENRNKIENRSSTLKIYFQYIGRDVLLTRNTHNAVENHQLLV